MGGGLTELRPRQVYFGKNAAELSLAESAMIAGL